MKRLFYALLLVLPLSMAQAESNWTQPFPGHRVAGNLYYVGSQDLSSYLIATSEGLILINSGLEESPKLIQASMQSLGFKFDEIKILLISHAHSDHCAGSAAILKVTGAQYCVMAEDADAVEKGGSKKARIPRSDYTQFPPARVDRRLQDGDEIKLGDSVLMAHKTAGHTPGCTTWTMKVLEGGRSLDAVIIGSPNVNPGYILHDNQAYPEIATDYEKTFATLKSLPVDLFLGAHGGYYNMAAKHRLLGHSDKNPFIDPEGYKSYVVDREQAFRAEWEKQKNR